MAEGKAAAGGQADGEIELRFRRRELSRAEGPVWNFNRHGNMLPFDPELLKPLRDDRRTFMGQERMRSIARPKVVTG